ncbi:MAG: Fic family protein [Bifidobacteriaceae bacterium]|nr:Fic family protein [Bifidobacteriaceae bacterium]
MTGKDDQLDRDPYVDPSSGLLRNVPCITTADELVAAEQDISFAATTALLAEQPWAAEQIDFDTLLEIHRVLFSRIYDWAGELRTIEISKGNTRFAFSDYLASIGRDIFARLASEDWLRDLDRQAFISRIAHYYADLNVLHPFREGNGRAIRTLLSLLAFQSRGVVIAWDRMDPAENIKASAYAYARDNSLLEAMFDGLIDA